MIAATGREHRGQNADAQRDHTDFPAMPLPHANAPNALRNYLERYDYDEVGNIERIIHVADAANWTQRYEYATDSNRLLSTSAPGDDPLGPFSHSYSYNAHGSITRMPHLHLMAWNFKEELQATATQLVNDGTPETTYYVYDAAGQRVRKVTERFANDGETPTRMKERLYLGGFEIYREYDADGTIVSLERETLHVMDDQQRIALIETRTQGNDGSPAQLIRYQLGNHLGSVALELDDTAALISYEEYHPYGTSAYQAVRSQIQTPKRYRFTGMEKDEESGFSYHSARYYAPWVGRWTSADPLGLVDGPNLYRYARNTPLLTNDPKGTNPLEVNSGNPNDPRNYVSFDSFRAGAQGPWTDEGLQRTWDEARATESARIPFHGSVSEDTRAELAAAGVFFMPDNSARIGTPVHSLVLPILAARLGSRGIPSLVEAPTLQGGSKTGRSSGFIDLTVLIPPVSGVGASAIEAHVYDLKPGGSSSGTAHAQQVERYVEHFDHGTVPGVDVISPQVGTALYDIAAQHPDVLAPIDVPGTNGTAYIGLQLTSPGIIEYHLGVRIPPVPVPVPERVPERGPVRAPEQQRIRTPDPKPVPWYIPVGVGLGAAAGFIAWKAKGCAAGIWAGPGGCVVGALIIP